MMRSLLPAAVALAAGCGDKDASSQGRPGTPQLRAAPLAPTSPTASVTGNVVDRDTQDPVADVEVVLRGEHGDVSARSQKDGAFAVVVPRGNYRIFVRDARVITIGAQGRIRVRSVPRADLAGVPDEQLMPLLAIDDDTKNIEVGVTAAAVISGQVTDPDGKPVDNVVIHALPLESGSSGTRPTVGPPVVRTAPRPALGTDTVISDASGSFVLRLPAGRYEMTAEHERYGGVAGIAEIELDAGGRHSTKLTLQRGCIISGHVIGEDGGPAHDGAIEVHSSFATFGPAGRIRSDGTFKWTTTDEELVELRAWPWQSSPSPPQRFECRDGKRFTNVVLRAGNARPDLTGTIVDAQGNPVPFAYLDVQPLDRGPSGQQERADAAGTWHVYDLPPGRFEVSAYAAGRGIVSAMVVVPREDAVLQLGGVGRIAGTTTELYDGSFELTFHHCGAASNPIEIDDDTRIVVVRGGRFTIDHVPACAVTFSARLRDRFVTDHIVVEPDRTAFVELALGKPREKTIEGTVRDAAGKPLSGIRVTALVGTQETMTVRSADDGTFVMKAPSGAQLVAGNGKRIGRALIGRANVASERVDLVVDATVDD